MSRRQPLSTGPSSVLDLIVGLTPVLVGIVVVWTLLIPAATTDAPPGAHIVPAWDLYTYFLPKYVYGSRELLAGRLPTWNPYEFGGVPFLATAQPAALYPPKILAFALNDPSLALRVFLFGHFVLMALTFGLFCRSQGIRWVGLFVGTAFWTLGTPILNSNYHPSRIANLAWIPLMFLYGTRITTTGSIRTAAALAAITTLQILAGYPEFALHGALLLGLYVVAVWLVDSSVTPPWRSIPLLALSFALAGLTAALQVLPFFEVLRWAERSLVTAELVERFSASEGSVQLRAALGMLGSFAPAVPALVGFVLAGLVQRRAVPATSGLLLCVAVIGIGWFYLRRLPGLEALQHPFAWLYTMQFFLAWLAAIGADRVFDRLAACGVCVTRAVVAFSALVWMMVAGARAIGEATLPAHAFAWVYTQQNPSLAAAGAVGSWNTSNVFAVGGASMLFVALIGLGRTHSRTIAVVAVAAMLAGHIIAFPFGLPAPALAPPDAPDSAGQRIRPEDRGSGRVLSLVDPYFGAPLFDRIEHVVGMEASLPPPRARAALRHLELSVAARRLNWSVLAQRPGYLDTLDVSVVVAPRMAAPQLEHAGLQPAASSSETLSVLLNTDRPGRAWGVHAVRIVDSPDAALAELMSPDFDPARVAILEAPTSKAYPAESSLPPTAATVRYPDPSIAEVNIEMAADGLLVLADACAPGWHAQVDGHPTTIHCANFLVRAVELERGPHHVTFEYRPDSVRWGLRLSAIGVILTVLLLIFGNKASSRLQR